MRRGEAEDALVVAELGLGLEVDLVEGVVLVQVVELVVLLLLLMLLQLLRPCRSLRRRTRAPSA